MMHLDWEILELNMGAHRSNEIKSKLSCNEKGRFTTMVPQWNSKKLNIFKPS